MSRISKESVTFSCFLWRYYDLNPIIFQKKRGKGNYLAIITIAGRSYAFESEGSALFQDGIEVRGDIGKPSFLGFAVNVTRQIRKIRCAKGRP
jgi:hypothetical protein